ncbi:unnamed protein product [Ilex paraguariensis]|uniref:Uncharacterized protein n=1 Tax=Ilex paraguariensis TaxID=185542 RepID=A0ABC8UNY9_9AQUA
MIRTLQEIKGGEGPIKVGATGKVSALMMQELDTMKLTSHSSISSRKKPQTVPVSVSCGMPTKRLQPRRRTSNGASTSDSMSNEDVSVDRTPSRGKTEKKGCQIVEIVDFNCGNPDKAWSGPITNQLKRLSFSRLSE